MTVGMLLLLHTSAFAMTPLLGLAPLGINVYVYGHPLRGAAYTLTQAGGATLWAISQRKLFSDIEYSTDDAFTSRWQLTLAACATLTAGSYIVSVLDSGHLHDVAESPELTSVRAFDRARWLASTPVSSLTLSSLEMHRD